MSDSHNESHDSHHPTVKTYLVIGVILTISTLAELWITEWAPGNTRNNLLYLFTIVKAVLVAAYFMHLKMDFTGDKRLFTVFFVIGIFVFALPFTLVMLILMT
ncbi:MAG: cytochrome C oxidase subunit IV family protein [Chloroflexota bacterium]